MDKLKVKGNGLSVIGIPNAFLESLCFAEGLRIIFSWKKVIFCYKFLPRRNLIIIQTNRQSNVIPLKNHFNVIAFDVFG